MQEMSIFRKVEENHKFCRGEQVVPARAVPLVGAEIMEKIHFSMEIYLKPRPASHVKNKIFPVIACLQKGILYVYKKAPQYMENISRRTGPRQRGSGKVYPTG